MSTPSPDDVPTETCYDSAELLPVKKPVLGFALADEGGDKGVRKMGYISRQVGDELVLGPIPYVSQRKCTMASVSVGYLLSSTNQNHGAFHISCKGCKCSPIHNPFQKELYPFPMVQTDARMVRNPAFHENNISITANTEFWAIMTPSSPCVVILTHAHTKNVIKNSSRVRIDSFSVADLDDGMLGYADRRGSGTHRLMVQSVRKNCTDNRFTNIN
ncbi:hypothetical protein AB1Y20_020142 [Prymnesium parvum]|uniref:Uncharacterized protein n=1 Tax=Prymnesium parvum TaxID=97485 RepID=A0AB34JYE7_PRYPA